ncbi:MAG: hypothetical protein ACJAV6_000235 [Candidatus Paceibacteria bacterium]|jgi:hypothetical protein
MKLKFLITGLFVIALAYVGVTSADAFSKATKAISAEAVPVTISIDNSQSEVAVSFTRTLRRGSYGTEVLSLQKALKNLGYYAKSLDSDYGSGTTGAVVTFQNLNGLTPDGVAGPKTYAKIIAKGGEFTLPPIVTDYNCDDDVEPVCGQQTINCVTTPCPQPEPKTFGNSCHAQAQGAKILYEGECDATKPVEEPIDTLNCLKVTPNSSNSPVYAELPVVSQQVAEFELENICDDKLYLEDVDFRLISSYAKPQIDDLDIFIDGDLKDSINDVSVSSGPTQIGGPVLTFSAGVNTILYPGDEVDLVIKADVWGAYQPWIGSSNYSTAFAISFDDADSLYNGEHQGWNKRPLWDNLIVVHYDN